MKKFWILTVLTICATLTVFAINDDDDERVIIHYQGTNIATIPADSVDSVAVVSKRLIKLFDKNKKILLSRMSSQIDSITIGQEQFDIEENTSKWEMSSSRASSAESSWVNNNKLYATDGTKTNIAYMSTESGGNSSQPSRAVTGSNIGVSNLYTNDALVFTVPVTKLKKGSIVDFMITLWATSSASPKYWIFEYEDNGEWKTVDEDLRTAKENASLKYSFYVKYFSSAHYTTFLQSFKTPRTLRDENLRMRCRVVGNYNNGGGTLSANSTAYVALVNNYYRSCYINTYQEIPAKDTLKVAFIGNSFTYYYSAPYMLQEIAHSQGHNIRMRSSVKGGMEFSDHLSLELSKDVIAEGGYDYALLQDYSGSASNYWKDTVKYAYEYNYAQKIMNSLKTYSPKIQNILENTWAFAGSDGSYLNFGNYTKFDQYLQNGSVLIATKTNSWMSPIGIAFEKARAEGITDLYHTDSKHPNRNGAYLKACVDYLMIYGQPFDENVPNCLVSPVTAQKLRNIAEEVVLNRINDWRNPSRKLIDNTTNITYDE